jgi:hypothetical protein
VCFYILPDALLDELCKFRGFAVQTKHKNTRGIMRYQLRIFQLILVVFLTGCTSGMKEDYVVTAILKKINLQLSIKQIVDNL